MLSIHHRGTEDAPGLVLALDARPGAVCHGLALRAEPEPAFGPEVVRVASELARLRAAARR